MMNTAEFAQILEAPASALDRLMQVGLIIPSARDAAGEPLWERTAFAYARLLLDLVEAGMTPLQLRRLTIAARARNTAADAALAVDLLLEDALPILRARLERVQRVVDDLERTRAALHRCGGCNQPREELGCRTCAQMPAATPRVLDHFFLPEDDDR